MRDAAAARRAEAAYAAVYAGVFLALGALIAFWPVWLEARGLSEAAIGWLSALAVGVRIVAGLAAPALADGLGGADRGAARATLLALAIGGAVVAAAHPPLTSLAALVAATALLAVAFGGFVPLAEADGYAAAERFGFSYQRARSVGSAGFLAATLSVGALVAQIGVDAVMGFIAAAFALAAFGAAATPRPQTAPAEQAARAPRRFRAALDGALAGAWALSRDRRLAIGVAAAAAIQASHAVYYTYGSLHWSQAGLTPPTIGLLWALGVAAEIVFFLTVGRALTARLGPRGAFTLAGLAAVARWGAMALEPGLAWLLFWQCLHALSFAAGHLALMAFVAAETRPEQAATAQGAAAAAIGVVLLVGTALASLLYPAVGAAAYGLGAALALLGVAAARALGPISR